MSTGGGVLGQSDFRRFFVGEIINTAGTAMAPIALAFTVLSVSRSATVLGWVIASWTVPMLALMLLGGVVADRLPRTAVLRVTNGVQAGTQLVTAVLVLSGSAGIWQLCVLQFLAGCAAAVGYPAVQSMIPVLLAPKDRKAAYLLMSQARSLLSIIGPAAAGALIASTSPAITLLVDAGTYMVAALCLARIRLPQREDNLVSHDVRQELRLGLGYANSLGWVLPGAALSLIYNAAISGGVGVLGPTIAMQTSIGSQGWGLARAVEAVGLFGFAFVLRSITLHRPLVACHLGFLVGGAPLLALGLFTTTLPIAVTMFAAGCGAALNELAWNLTIQEKIPEHMLSRIMSVDGFFSYLALPVGQLAVGPLAQTYGPRTVEIGAAALFPMAFIAAMATPAIRNLTLDTGRG